MEHPARLKSAVDPVSDAGSVGLWLASPGNPTGAALRPDEMTKITTWARNKNVHLLMDEIYHGLHYSDALPSVLEMDTEAFVVNSFSKYFGMTGWRLGWVVVPEAYVEQSRILAQNLFISASSIAQQAALAAFSEEAMEIFESRRAAFKQRRDFLSRELAPLKFVFSENIQGAFYVYADVSFYTNDAESFCRTILDEHGVAMTPGTDFGEFRAGEHVRLAFTTSMEELEKGIERLQRALLSI